MVHETLRNFTIRFFFLQLPFGHHGPVSELSLSKSSKLYYTGPFNWGEARCAGEKVKHKKRTINWEVFYNTKQTTSNSNQGAARHGNQEPSGQAPSYA